MSNEKALGARLASAIPYVTQGGRVADIGTDHAYLPIELIRQGICQKALACDIGAGPLARARAHIESAGLSENIQTLLTNGLQGVEPFAPTDVIVFGMGGELIANILDAAPWVREKQTNLILQPMTKAELLRRYLNENGFEILSETLICEEHYYQILHARYTGRVQQYTEAELLVGKWLQTKPSPYGRGFLERQIALLSAVVEGKRQGNANAAKEEAILKELKHMKNALTEETP